MLVEIFTDGSTLPKNPGRGGAGAVVLLDNEELYALGKNLGYSTNNSSELNAIKIALECFLETTPVLGTKVIIYSDSDYSLNCVSGQMKANKHRELVSEIRSMLEKLPEVKLYWIRSEHSLKSKKGLKDEHRRLFFWNKAVDKIAKKSARMQDDYFYSKKFGREEFIKEFTKVENT